MDRFGEVAGVLMRFRYPIGALVLGLVLAAPIGVLAQRPIAVPIVGSPAAQPQQPQQPPAQVPAQPPPMPNPPAAPPASQTASPAPQTPASRSERKLELSFKDGTLALDAQNVTIRDILMEWQRRNGCQFVNADKLPATPVTIQFSAGTPELDAIDSLLRGLATPTTGYGYIVAPGSGEKTGVCGAVYILPSSRPTSAANYAPPAGPIAAPIMTNGSPDTEIPPVVPFMPPGQPQAYPGVVSGGQQGQQNPNAPAPNRAPPPQSPGFAPIAPTAPGAGRFGAPPTPPPAQPPAPNGNGRGGF
jgi:hypothetical protein